MKTSEIIAALRCCASAGWSGCSYCRREELDVEEVGCGDALKLFAADRLEELVERCARYAEEIAVLRERQRWIPVTERLPETDELVLAIVSGRPSFQLRLENAIELASFWRDDGWVLEEFPEWEDPQVSHWMPLPAEPEVEKALEAIEDET